MKDLSSLLAGLLPWALLRYAGLIPSDDYIITGIVVASLFVMQVFHFGLNRWHHPGILIILALGQPAMTWVYMAARQELFLPVFYGLALLVLVSANLGAWLQGAWDWGQVGVNIAFFATGLVLAGNLAAISGIEGLQVAVLTCSAYGITRLCGVDLLSWVRHLPILIMRGLEKLWY
jgi:hypothetical protein